MHDTKHFTTRMNHRGIKKELLELALEIGERNPAREGSALVLDRKAIRTALAELDRLTAQLTKLLDKGGVKLIECDGVLITGYRVD